MTEIETEVHTHRTEPNGKVLDTSWLDVSEVAV